jgi:NAD-dependent dihydropyrimidine dehydrogenase PreA subunit
MAECRDAEIMMPQINLGKCEGKADCFDVCPYHVFEIRKATTEERAGFNTPEKIKSFVHGHKKAFVTDPTLCHACGLCVKACPEKAISLIRFAS